MYLKSLTLRGFKSFADKTTLKFEPGVTAIVGPNGSGKSNVTDAVLWVLGEQSPRSLRGGSMEDVIFAGSATRQALGVAEVVLTLDNSDGALPIEFSEVTIARRVYRTGESEYYINNSACRLLDIQELLSGSGLGRGFYSIIGQGRIEEALTAKPEERRVFIEEAAGVLKHKRRRDRAVKRLSSMDANLIRVKDILSEVNRQLAPLKRQAELARSHAELTEELKRHELSIAVLDLKELQVKWASLEADTATAKQYIKGHESDLARIESELESTELNLEAAESRVSDLSEKRHRIESAGDRLRAVASLVAEKARNAAERLETLSAGSYRAATRKLVLEKQAQQSMRELDQVDLAISKGDERLAAAESDFERTVEKARGLKSRLNDLEAAIGADERAVGNYETAVANLDLAIKTGEAQLEILREQRSSVEARHLKVGADLKEALGSEESLVVQVAELESKLSGLEVEKRRAEANLAASREDLSRAEKDNESCLARMKTLEETIEDGDPDASTAFKAGGEDAIAILGESISVPKKYEKAIEAVLGGDFYCLVVKETDAVRKLASLVDDRLSILSLDRAEPKRSAKEGLVSAASIIECLATVRPAVDALLDGVYVAADLEMALAVEGGESTIVTLDGEVVHPTGKVVLGTKSDLLGQLARRREIGELGGMLARMSKTVAKIKSCCEELSASLKSLEEAALSVSRDLEARRAEMNAAHQRIESVKREVDAVAQELKVIDDRAATFTSRLEVEAHKLEENRMRLVKLRASLEERRAEMGAVRTSREECLKEEAEASLKVSKAKVELDALVGRRRGVERAYGEALNELAEIKSTIDRDEVDVNRLVLVRERSAPLISAIEALAVCSEENAKRVDESIATDEEGLVKLKESLQSHRESASGTRIQLESGRKRLHEVEIVKAQLEMEVTTAVSRIVDELDVPLEKALQLPIERERPEIEERASHLKRRIASIGPVNPMAIEEHKDLEERAALFSRQIEDITESRRALGKIIRAIDRKIKERFMEAFLEINGHFGEIFKYLFPGGNAELILTEPDDPDITGVDIIAQPSGKRLQRLSLLSGGEKSLVSLAFLFSLYLTRPCPFYILDEAEAALDDINLNRLIKLLIEMKRATQFLVVTHQRRTMEMTDALYGVSMQADGVSKLISQKFSEVAGVV